MYLCAVHFLPYCELEGVASGSMEGRRVEFERLPPRDLLQTTSTLRCTHSPRTSFAATIVQQVGMKIICTLTSLALRMVRSLHWALQILNLIGS